MTSWTLGLADSTVSLSTCALRTCVCVHGWRGCRGDTHRCLVVWDAGVQCTAQGRDLHSDLLDAPHEQDERNTTAARAARTGNWSRPGTRNGTAGCFWLAGWLAIYPWQPLAPRAASGRTVNRLWQATRALACAAGLPNHRSTGAPLLHFYLSVSALRCDAGSRRHRDCHRAALESLPPKRPWHGACAVRGAGSAPANHTALAPRVGGYLVRPHLLGALIASRWRPLSLAVCIYTLQHVAVRRGSELTVPFELRAKHAGRRQPAVSLGVGFATYSK